MTYGRLEDWLLVVAYLWTGAQAVLGVGSNFIELALLTKIRPAPQRQKASPAVVESDAEASQRFARNEANKQLLTRLRILDGPLMALWAVPIIAGGVSAYYYIPNDPLRLSFTHWFRLLTFAVLYFGALLAVAFHYRRTAHGARVPNVGRIGADPFVNAVSSLAFLAMCAFAVHAVIYLFYAQLDPVELMFVQWIRYMQFLLLAVVVATNWIVVVAAGIKPFILILIVSILATRYYLSFLHYEI